MIPALLASETGGHAAPTFDILSALVVRRMIDHLDLVAVLKSKE